MTEKRGFIIILLILIGTNLYQFSISNNSDQAIDDENCPSKSIVTRNLHLKCFAFWFEDEPEFPNYPLSIIFRTTLGNKSGAIELNDEGRYSYFKEGKIYNFPIADNYTFLIPDLDFKLEFTREI